MDVNFFSEPSDYTNLGSAHHRLSKAPNDLSELCKLVQGNLIHSYWLEHYSVDIDDSQRFLEMQLRSAKEILDAAAKKSGLSCDVVHPPQDRIVSICRDFSLILCSILRAKGIPARIRSGFATYLVPDKFEDHWVCEYWDEMSLCWRMVDAQLDDTHWQILGYQFNPCDVPTSQFLLAGKAWQLCRTHEMDADKFGFEQFTGLEFIKGSIIRDLYALSKFEMHTWDTGWGILEKYLSPIAGSSELAILDDLAAVSADSDYEEAIKLVRSCESIRLPNGWTHSMFPTIAELIASNSPVLNADNICE